MASDDRPAAHAGAAGARYTHTMRVVPSIATAIAIVAALGAASCSGDPPDKEIQQAQGAIDAARAAGADRYAIDEFVAAQDALKRAHDAVGERDYRLALSNALDSRERAQNAAKMAADGKAQARVAADRALQAATDALEAAKAALKGAETVRAAAKAVTTVRAGLADAERRLQEARTTFDQGEYATTVTLSSAITNTMKAATSDLEAASGVPARRRR
jgi:hypothetical protein